MDNTSLLKELEELLRPHSQYTSDDGVMLKNSIVEAALDLRPDLLKLLLSNEKLKKNFFTDIEGTLVFDKVRFQKFVMNKRFLPDSYTSFKNKIGLTGDDEHFLSDSREVVLSWPYKDCVLEGGQTKEDAKRNEIFWNEILAPDDINRLIEPKALTHFIKYDNVGHHKVDTITKEDNLIIKGNNLLVLQSLKKNYRGKVKLIYIDPPYYFNKVKPSDSFSYNSNFRLSSWLTFMKDRLKLAQELLMTNGVLLCHIGEDGFHWLKLLTSEIFGADNFVETFIWKNTDNPDSLSNKSRSSVEYILCFEKKKDTSVAYKGKETENGDAPILHTSNSIHELLFPKGSIHFNIPDGEYPCGKPDRVELLTPITVKNSLNTDDVKLKGEFTWSQDTLKDNLEAGCYFLVKSNKFSVRVQLPEGKSMAPEKFIDEQYLSKAIGVGTNEDANTHLKKMGIEFPYSKPESVVAFFINAVTEKKDIVLDFFVGSGTTAAVAHKLGRRYIGVEQMDYIETVTVERLKKVIGKKNSSGLFGNIEYDNGGISQTVNWQGGGSFIYCELAKANQIFVDEIIAATKTEELLAIWKKIQETGFISWKIDPQQINAEIATFEELTIEDQKKFLIEVLDKNLLYVPYSEIDNKDFAISEEDKKLNNGFYNM